MKHAEEKRVECLDLMESIILYDAEYIWTCRIYLLNELKRPIFLLKEGYLVNKKQMKKISYSQLVANPIFFV